MYRRQPPRRYACTRCVRLKVKCVPAGSGACQRCTRLGHLSCVFPAELRGNPTAGRISSGPPSISDEAKSPKFHGLIDDKLADELLSKYRAQKVPHFPFVVIPLGANAATLREQSPFFLLCILTASLEHNSKLQEELELVIRKEVANRIVVGIERNMDLLQGLLVHGAWYHYHWKTYHTHMYMLLQMTLMVTADLYLDKQESFRMQTIPAEGKEPDSAYGTKESTSQTAAQQRALLGCYYLCSKSSLFRRQIYMRYSQWINDCADALAERREHPTDSKLKVYIDAQSLVRRSQLLFDEERRGLHPASDNWEQILEIMSQQGRMESLLSQLHGQDWPLRIELGGLPALILGQALGRQKHVFKLREMNQLQPLIDSAHYVVDTYLETPAPATLHFSSTSYITIWFSLLVLSKLSLLFHPNKQQATGVNKKHVQNKGVAIIQRFKDISPEEDGFWTSSSKSISTLLAWLEKSNTEAPPGSASADTQTASDNNAATSQSSQLLGLNATHHQPVWPLTDTPDVVASMNGQFQPVDDFDVHVWQQLLDSFTWFGPPEEGFGLGHYDM